MIIENNRKRIVLNTIMLYTRTFIIMIVSLYSSRIILKELGETDFGIYNLVGGVVLLFAFLNNAMASATQRFINIELVTGNINSLKRIFSMSMTAHIIIALLLIVIAETFGIWFLNNKLNIPHDRLLAAHWVYQFSILTCCMKILRIPYNAVIIAYEKMNIYAYIGILEGVLQLITVYLLLIIKQDSLISYSILVFLIAVIVNIMYLLYCLKTYNICKYIFFWDRHLAAKITSFSSWSLLGSTSNVVVTQGNNILLNIFYGITANAAIGIANQVSSAVYTFISNFQTAFNPQIMKSFVTDKAENIIKLIFQTSKYSYYLVFLFVFPAVLFCRDILSIWLINTPENSVIFTQLLLIFLLVETISAPLWMSVQASGHIKKYQIIISTITLLNIPLALALLYFNFPAYSVLILKIIINLFAHIARVLYLKQIIYYSIRKYMTEVIFPCILVSILSIPIPLLLKINTSFHFILLVSISLISILISIFFLGLSVGEKIYISKLIYKKWIIKKK